MYGWTQRVRCGKECGSTKDILGQFDGQNYYYDFIVSALSRTVALIIRYLNMIRCIFFNNILDLMLMTLCLLVFCRKYVTQGDLAMISLR